MAYSFSSISLESSMGHIIYIASFSQMSVVVNFNLENDIMIYMPTLYKDVFAKFRYGFAPLKLKLKIMRTFLLIEEFVSTVRHS